MSWLLTGEPNNEAYRSQLLHVVEMVGKYKNPFDISCKKYANMGNEHAIAEMAHYEGFETAKSIIIQSIQEELKEGK